MYTIPTRIQTVPHTLSYDQAATARKLPVRILRQALHVDDSPDADIPNTAASGWTVHSVKSSVSVWLKAPTSWTAWAGGIVLVAVSNTRVLEWQAIGDLVEIPFKMVYSLSKNELELMPAASVEKAKAAGKILGFDSLVRKSMMTSEDHGKVFKVIVPGSTAPQRGVYLHSEGKGSFYSLEKKAVNRPTDFAHVMWATPTPQQLSASVADMLWVEQLGAIPEHQRMGAQAAIAALPVLRADDLNTQDRKLFNAQAIKLMIEPLEASISRRQAMLSAGILAAPSVKSNELVKSIAYPPAAGALVNLGDLVGLIVELKLDVKTSLYDVAVSLRRSRYVPSVQAISLQAVSMSDLHQLLQGLLQSGQYGIRVKGYEGKYALVSTQEVAF